MKNLLIFQICKYVIEIYMQSSVTLNRTKQSAFYTPSSSWCTFFIVTLERVSKHRKTFIPDDYFILAVSSATICHVLPTVRSNWANKIQTTSDYETAIRTTTVNELKSAELVMCRSNELSLEAPHFEVIFDATAPLKGQINNHLTDSIFFFFHNFF